MPLTAVPRATLAATLLTAACHTAARAPSPDAARASLLAADRAFAEATDARGVDGWMSYFAPDAVTMPEGQRFVQDTAQVRAEIAGLLSGPGVKLRWTPERAEISTSRDLGYTYGYWRVVRRVATPDSEVAARGKYVTIWRRAASGDWKVVLDMGNSVKE